MLTRILAVCCALFGLAHAQTPNLPPCVQPCFAPLYTGAGTQCDANKLLRLACCIRKCSESESTTAYTVLGDICPNQALFLEGVAGMVCKQPSTSSTIDDGTMTSIGTETTAPPSIEETPREASITTTLDTSLTFATSTTADDLSSTTVSTTPANPAQTGGKREGEDGDDELSTADKIGIALGVFAGVGTAIGSYYAYKMYNRHKY